MYLQTNQAQKVLLIFQLVKQLGYVCYHGFFKILVVRACVRDECGRGRNKFEGRVQNHHMRISFQLSQKWKFKSFLK